MRVFQLGFDLRSACSWFHQSCHFWNTIWRGREGYFDVCSFLQVLWRNYVDSSHLHLSYRLALKLFVCPSLGITSSKLFSLGFCDVFPCCMKRPQNRRPGMPLLLNSLLILGHWKHSSREKLACCLESLPWNEADVGVSGGAALHRKNQGCQGATTGVLLLEGSSSQNPVMWMGFFKLLCDLC